jgi:hypothetical protein
MHLRQVSGSEFGRFHPRSDLLFEFIESAPQDAVVRDGLDGQEAAVSRKTDLPESGQVPQAFGDVECRSVRFFGNWCRLLPCW